MRILPNFSCPTRSINNNLVNAKKYNYTSQIMNNNVKDTVSFSGKDIFLSGYLNQINDNEFPDDLYLNLDEVFEILEEKRFYHRWEILPEVLADLLAKRCNYLGLTECAEGDGIASSPSGSYGWPRRESILISEYDKEKNSISIEFNWTKEFHELEGFFKGNKENPIGAEVSMEKIKEGLPDILRKQGWIK